MPLVTTKKMLLDAQKGGYAIGAFNVENMEMAQAVVSAAVKASAPVILQTTSSTLKYAGPETFQAIVRSLAQSAPVPVAIHLDHGNSYELCRQCLDAGYTSIMIDGSKLPFAENLALAKKVVAISGDIPVEAELGKVGGKEDELEVNDPGYTDVDEAIRYAQESGISSFAVAIGTAHGFYKGTPKLDIGRLAQINASVSVPLVLHGASGLTDDTVKECIKNGICKVNFATELRHAYTEATRKVLLDSAVYDPKDFGKAGRSAVEALVIGRMNVCGCAGKA